MTAEIGILSRLGVALAADSAVTIGTRGSKTYASAEKLFQLADTAPVGAMIYGGASMLGVPWETTVKLFRGQLHNKTLQTLGAYVDAFISFLGENKALFPAKSQERFVSRESLSLIRFVEEQSRSRRDKLRIQQERELLEAELDQLFSDVLTDLEAQVTSGVPLDNLPENFASDFFSLYATVINAAAKSVVGGWPLRDVTLVRLGRWVATVFGTRTLLGDDSTGVVIAGFGDDEHFPRLTELRVAGVAMNTLLFHRGKVAEIGDADGQMNAFILPFAQSEMVHNFMEGIDPDLKAVIMDSTAQLFRGYAELLAKKLEATSAETAQAVANDVRPRVDSLVKRLLQSWEEVLQRRFVEPVMVMVDALPKDELAAMAESLVNLTKFKKRVSRQQEDVGGPIDVAVITKGDGFIWAKRKHYFRPELNLRYLARYNQGVRIASVGERDG